MVIGGRGAGGKGGGRWRVRGVEIYHLNWVVKVWGKNWGVKIGGELGGSVWVVNLDIKLCLMVDCWSRLQEWSNLGLRGENWSGNRGENRIEGRNSLRKPRRDMWTTPLVLKYNIQHLNWLNILLYKWKMFAEIDSKIGEWNSTSRQAKRCIWTVGAFLRNLNSFNSVPR